MSKNNPYSKYFVRELSEKQDNTSAVVPLQPITNSQENIDFSLVLLNYVKTANSEGKYSVLSEDNNKKVLNRSKDYLNTNNFDPKSLSTEQIKSIQKLLIQEGFLANVSSNFSKKEVYDILTKNGYKYYVRHPESISRKTLEKDYKEFLYNLLINGIWDESTLDAWDLYTSPNRNWGLYCSPTGKCAKFVTKKYESVVGNSAAIPHGVISNAWQMPMNILDKGGEELYNIYRGMIKPKSVSLLKKSVTKKVLENPLNLKLLLPGDIIGVNFPNSSHFEEALGEGTTYNTHVGIVTGLDTDSIPIITHDMGVLGLRQEKANNLPFNSNITVAVRPRGGGISPITIIPKQSSISLPEEYQSEEMLQFLNTAEGSLPVMKKLFPNINPEEVRDILVSVLKRETNFMKNKVSDLGISGSIKESVKNTYRKMKGMEQDTKSSNLTKFKLKTLDRQAKLMLGITSPEDLEIPHNAAVAGMYVLSRNYDYLKRLLQLYPDLGITDNDIKYAVISSYNLGMGKYYHLGFDPKTGQARPEELVQLRSYADPNNKIMDISATDYRHFKALGLGNLGNFLYQNLEEPHVPYIAAALEALKLFNKTK